MNGDLAGYFQSERGLRQGCSLSPYLFVICMNVLSKMLDDAAKKGKIGYHPRCKNIDLTHLCFTDDLMIITDGTRSSIDGIIKIFEDFDKMSGLKISRENQCCLWLVQIREGKRYYGSSSLLRGSYLFATLVCLY